MSRTRRVIGSIEKNRQGSRLVVAIQGGAGHRVVDVREEIGNILTNHHVSVSAYEWAAVLPVIQKAIAELEAEAIQP